MTCIVGIVHDGIVFMGGDSMTTNGYDRIIEAVPKVFRTGEFLIGCAGSPRMAQLLQYHLTVDLQTDQSNMAYMVTVFCEAFREMLKEHGYAKQEDTREIAGDDVLLVGYKGNLYLVDPDFSVIQPRTPYQSIGSGGPIAMGALHVTPADPPEQRILKALEAASEHSANVSPPFCIEVLEAPNKWG